MLLSSRSFDARINKALADQSTLLNSKEHCSADARLLATIGRARRQQVRVRLEGGEDYLFTVSEVRPERPRNIVRLGKDARTRLAAVQGQKALVASEVPNPDLSEKPAKAAGEFIERLLDVPSENNLVAIAPHGGEIEKWTDKQAEMVAKLLRVTCWRCRGYQTDGGAGAASRWHITSTDIHEASFPLLNKIIDRDFVNAVSFHGFLSRDEGEILADIIIGGRARKTLKRRIQQALMRALPSDIVVEIAAAGSRFAGSEKRNLVNRLASDGNGIQIEQNLQVRKKHWRAIAEAVAREYASVSVAITRRTGKSPSKPVGLEGGRA
jgi:phage replication-related protein YjqB (UPF0714/DUF867 family)